MLIPSSGVASSLRAAFRARVEYSSTRLRLGQLDDRRCDDHLPCCHSDEGSNAKRGRKFDGQIEVGYSWEFGEVEESVDRSRSGTSTARSGPRRSINVPEDCHLIDCLNGVGT